MIMPRLQWLLQVLEVGEERILVGLDGAEMAPNSIKQLHSL